MHHPLSNAMQKHVQRYVAGDLTVSEFEAWFWPATIKVEQASDVRAEAMTYDIMLRLAEYSKGHGTEAELKDLLCPIGARTPIVTP